MNKVLRAGLAIGVALITLGIITATVQAAGSSNCKVIYGGGEICPDDVKFSIDKKIQTPTKGGAFVDNISTNDHRFRAGDTVTFRIRVTNTGNQNISSLTVTDTLPEHVTFKSGPGSLDNRNLTYTITDLAVGDTREHDISVTVNSNLPSSQGVICPTNTVVARDNKGNEAKDEATFCIERDVVKKPTPQVFEPTPVKKIPETGPAMLPLLGLIPAGIAGFIMRRKSKLN